MKMLKFKKILVPYDGSSYAKKALAAACDTAALIPGAALFIATVTPAEQPKEKVRISKSTAVVDEPPPKNPGELLLEEADALIPKNIPRELILRVGNPGEELVTLTLQKPFDLIIMGSRGRGALKSLLMGSVSSHLVNNVKCSVWIIK